MKYYFVIINKLFSDLPLVNNYVMLKVEALDVLHEFLRIKHFKEGLSGSVTYLRPIEYGPNLGLLLFIYLINM